MEYEVIRVIFPFSLFSSYFFFPFSARLLIIKTPPVTDFFLHRCDRGVLGRHTLQVWVLADSAPLFFSSLAKRKEMIEPAPFKTWARRVAPRSSRTIAPPPLPSSGQKYLPSDLAVGGLWRRNPFPLLFPIERKILRP